MRQSYRVTAKGLAQIREWLLYEWCCGAEDVADIDSCVAYYAWKAEDSEDGEIELRARETASGRIAYLRPEVEAVQEDDMVYDVMETEVR